MAKPTDQYASIRIPEFRLLVSGTFLLTVALMMQEVVLGYELYRITRDPLALGMIGLMEAVPFIAFCLYGGHVADVYSKRKILMAAVGVIGLGSFTLQLVDRFSSNISQSTFLAVIYSTIFLIGLCRAFQSPASSSLRAFVVPRELYENAAAWSSSSWQTGAILGPTMAGFLYVGIGFANTLLVVTLLVFSGLALYSRIGEKPSVVLTEHESVWASIKEGIRFVLKTKIIFYSISLDLFSVLFGGVMALLPIYAEDILHVGAEGLGILRAATSVGTVATLVLMTRFSPMNHPWRNLLVVVLGFGICILIFAISPWFILSVVALVLSGAFDGVSVVIRSTLLQVMTPDDMRGRVMAVNGIFISSSNELGAFESGVAAKLLGTVPSAIFGGVVTLAIVGWVYIRTKELMSVRIARGN
jgi:MFS family permease